MQFVADLHLHSRYSRAVSQQMVLPVMARFAKQKGLDILTASDFTHPLWFKEIQGLLEESGEGIYTLKQRAAHSTNSVQEGKEQSVYFLLSTEISSIYKQGEKLRRIHNLVFVPNFDTADKVSKELVKRGCNLMADGRPIIGLSSKQLLEMILSIDEYAFLIPCHIWTPHFGIYGSASGFDSLEESFGELSKYVYGVETGLSSDPEMNWQIGELEERSILSFSDAHSPAKMGREATVMALADPTYENIRLAIMEKALNGKETRIGKEIRQTLPPNETGPVPERYGAGIVTEKRSSRNRIVYTVEFYPEEGKYHFSGHRNCKVVFGPQEILEKGSTCPVCKRGLTEGVLFRVQQLAGSHFIDRVEVKHNEYSLKWFTDKTKKHPPFVKLVPLLEIVAESMESTVASQKVQDLYTQLCQAFDSELTVLLKTPIDNIRKQFGDRLADGIVLVRKGDIVIDPGFDGEYGKVAIWAKGSEGEKHDEKKSAQMSFDL